MAASNTSSDTGEFIDSVDRVALPEPIDHLADEYATLFDDRDRFLWRWIYSLFPAFTLSSVPPAVRQDVRIEKTVLTMYVTVLDDLVEQHDDLETLEEARRLVSDPETANGTRAGVSSEQFEFIETLWSEFRGGVTDAPRHDEFAEILEYDLRQTSNAMRYSAVLNRNPRIANLDGARRYDAHNMVMFPYADVDLMFSPDFALKDFGAVRDLIWDLQELARIGNWLTTWRREVHEGDYTAGIVVHAIQEGIVDPGELCQSPSAVVETIANEGIEQRFRERWERKYREVSNQKFQAESVDLDALVDGMETVFEYHQASEGHK